MNACEQMDAHPLFAVKASWLPIIGPMAEALNPGGQYCESFDIDSCDDCEPPATLTEWQAFEAARRAAAGQPDIGW